MIKKFLLSLLFIFSLVNNCFAICESVDQQQTTINVGNTLGDSGDTEYRLGQSFQLSSTSTVTAVEIQHRTTGGSPTGNWTIRIETSDGGSPSMPTGTLANANASIVVSPPGDGTVIKGTFATSFSLNGSTEYWIVILCDNQSTNVAWYLGHSNTDIYANGEAAYQENGVWKTVWSPSNQDAYFKIYIDTCPPTSNTQVIWIQ